jgi:hypothetical protein
MTKLVGYRLETQIKKRRTFKNFPDVTTTSDKQERHVFEL